MYFENIKETIDKFWNNIPSEYYDSFQFEYSEFGGWQAVTLHIHVHQISLEINIWDSENNQLKWIESKNEYEKFDVYLKRKMNEIKKSIDTFKKLL